MQVNQLIWYTPGDMFLYDIEPYKVHSTAAPAATSVDIENKRILTPFGEFRISWMDAGKVSFDGEQGHLRVSGSLTDKLEK